LFYPPHHLEIAEPPLLASRARSSLCARLLPTSLPHLLPTPHTHTYTHTRTATKMPRLAALGVTPQVRAALGPDVETAEELFMMAPGGSGGGGGGLAGGTGLGKQVRREEQGGRGGREGGAWCVVCVCVCGVGWCRMMDQAACLEGAEEGGREGGGGWAARKW